MQIGSVVWEEFDHIGLHTYIHTYIHTESGQCGSQYTRNAQYQTCFAGFDKNNLHLFGLTSDPAINTVRRAALNCCHTRRTAIESTAPA